MYIVPAMLVINLLTSGAGQGQQQQQQPPAQRR
jgi:hypothetical protein